MPEKINWSLNVQVAGGPKIGVSQNLVVHAYDKIDVQIPDADPKAAPLPPALPPDPPEFGAPGQAIVQIQPGGVGQVKFLLIQSSVYDAKLTYKVNGKGADIALDQMHLFMGVGALAALGPPPVTLVFSNSIWDPGIGKGRLVNIQVLAGRDAIEKPPA